MMNWLAGLVANRSTARWIVVLVVLVALGAGYMASRLEHEDDILAFLPQDNPEVELFHDINKRFGGTDVALVGLEVDDPFDRAFLKKLAAVTHDLDRVGSLDHVLSVINVLDITPDQELGGIVTAPLVSEIPENDAEEQALREKVMSRDHVVGNLISRDQKAVLIYCYLGYDTNPKLVAAEIQAVVTDAFPELEKYWGGGPFISTYVYNTTQRDLQKLTPWAVLAIVLIMMLIFRDPIGTSVVLLATGAGIVVSLGLMSTLGVKFNIVLSSMPVILFAVGTAYGVHMLARYYALAAELDPEIALHRAVTETGPVVVAAGLTTVVSLLSFMLMDIRPLRIFGLFTAIGILGALVFSITFIPAVVSLTRLKRKPVRARRVEDLMAAVTRFAQTHRLAVGLALLAVGATGAGLISRVDTSVDQSTFFNRDSPPDLAERFLVEHFGGGTFVQIHADGDMNDPHVLREMRRVADEIVLLDEVASVNDITFGLAQTNNAMVGQLRLPDTDAQVRLLYTFLDDPSVDQLVTRDHEQALMHVKIRSNQSAVIDRVLGAIEGIISGSLIGRGEVVSTSDAKHREASGRRVRTLVAARIRALAKQYGVALRYPAEKLDEQLKFRPERLKSEPIALAMARFLRSEECAVELPAEPGGPVDQIAEIARAIGPIPHELGLAERIAEVLEVDPSDLLVEDLVLSMETPLAEMWARQRAVQQFEALARRLRLEVPEGGPGERFTTAMTTALLDLESEWTMLPATVASEALWTRALVMQVNGLPVMHRGLSRSVTKNQLLSVSFALVLVLVIMSWLFRSVTAGLMATTPTLLTLLVVYGGMGLLGVHLDIGTSMLASIVLGAGVDYAVHLVAAWQVDERGTLADAAGRAAGHTGPAIWTNAVMIAAGFAVLTLGEARPLKNVGGLTATAMVTAALATFLAIPVLARRRRYHRMTNNPPEAMSAAVEDGARHN